jgi:FSR family fosmidomycin resistance protein-like MFS transporter
MASESITITTAKEESSFQTEKAAPILLAHFIHDIYTAAVAPLLPVLIEKLSLSLTAAGSLSAIMQLPAVLNPFIGYLADKISVRYFVICAPAVTATMISLIGFAPSYLSLAILLFAAGVSTAAFHAPAPAMIARLSGNRVGLGMSLFMAAGSLGFAVGPLLAVWAVSTWTLDGFWRLVFVGWATSIFLFIRLRGVAARPEKTGSLRAMLPVVGGLFGPIIFFNLFRNPMIESLTTYLPTYMNQQGASLLVAGASLSIIELAGVAGSLTIGVWSDRVGRKKALFVASLATSLLMLVFLRAPDWMIAPLLLGLGFVGFSVMPVMLSIVQEQFPNNRATANGLYMAVIFLLRPLGTLAVGMLGDRLGLQNAFFISALVSLLTLPVILTLPDKPKFIV